MNKPVDKSCMDLDSQLLKLDKSQRDLQMSAFQSVDLKQSEKYHLQECVLLLEELQPCILH